MRCTALRLGLAFLMADGPADLDSRSQELRFVVHLGQPFSALSLAQQRGVQEGRFGSRYHRTGKEHGCCLGHDGR
ncbi:uncharacterized protein EDB91DRAFT_1107641 [Suillus paluster]|uniref:uncharacterized protein n=1 Tax=Suillus paluster TaxID=48578 RepID=UPI001B8836C9|nr:uncharacterized protein EDB91DRAFT_1107641 [Suillus paluster]KAG1750467.1 hypothetical protein EDB91DRAFT_1107641 [Suillus paluster]